MKSYRMALFIGAFVSAGGILHAAGAADIPASVQKHTDIAKAAAYRPGHDLTSLYEAVCRPALSGKARDENPPKTDPAPGSTQLSQYKVPPRSEWVRQPAKVFDNLYWLGSHSDSLAVSPAAGLR